MVSIGKGAVPPVKKQFPQTVLRFLGSRTFFGLIIVLFVLQAAWIALSARYPQAFDEQFHFGLIQLHAHQLSPVFGHQPENAEAYGAIVRDPSYLYHYLLSFPYRLISMFTHNQTVQVIILRFVNIALLTTSLYVFKKVLGFATSSKALVHTLLFFFVIVPVVPLLGSQINYDNLLIPVIGLALWWFLRFQDSWLRRRVWRWDTLAELLIICLFASLIKFSFLPFFVVIVGFVGWLLFKQRRHITRRSFAVLSKAKFVVYALLIVLGVGLSIERYGVNLVKYHSPTPECDQILSIDECQEYAPWARNYYNIQHKVPLKHEQKITYPATWLKHSVSELVFTIGSGYNSAGIIDYYVGTQLPIPELLAWLTIVVGLILGVIYRRWLWANPVLRLFLVVSGVYLLALLAQNWREYIHLGQLVAIHGRYDLPVLPLLFVIIALCIRKFLSEHVRPVRVVSIKVAGVLVVVVLMTQGGGIVTYLVRNDFWWFWPQSSAAQRINSDAKRLLQPLIIGAKTY